MSDTAIFIAASAEDLKAANGLPGDLKTLRTIPDERERVVHTEILLDSPSPERFQQGLSQAGVWITVLPQTGDADSALVTGLMERLHEFVCTYPSVGQFVLAGHRPERLTAAAAFLQRAGFNVVLCGPDRNKLEACRHSTDDVEEWGGGGGGRGSRSGGDGKSSKDLDPFEVLVEEITKSRKRGHRVLLTSLKQRMRKRIRRFDETRLKDKDGKPMRKFKDFVVDAANRGLIQLIEKGNASHVLLPDEAADAGEDEDEARGDTGNGNGNDNEDGDGIDPLLDSVDTVGDDDDNGDGDEEGDDEDDTDADPEAGEPLSPEAIDVDEIDEEADPPPKEFMDVLAELLQKPLSLEELVQALVKKQSDGVLDVRTRVLRDYLQSAFNNELIETQGEEKPPQYVLVDDWKDIIDYL